jgi:hypothetical protein
MELRGGVTEGYKKIAIKGKPETFEVFFAQSAQN